ncbi:MAG: hypothetical protein K0S61_4655, partial [Anaerocolumna sp.]|nr:hypothetical protein [Anaerocolumna sp.]
MKKRLSIIGIVLLILISGYIISEIIHLKIYDTNKQINLNELTKNEKKEDFEYLTRLVDEVYPFSDLLYEVKGIKNIKDSKEQFILKAQETK